MSKTLLPTPYSLLPYLLLVICYLLFSCTTAPKVAEQTVLESGIMPLSQGASAYALVDVPKARPILEGISFIPSNNSNVKLMLDKTHSAVLAVFSPSTVEDRRYQLVSWGSYPATGSGMAFGASKDWTKQRSAFQNIVYWHSEKAQMSVAVGPSQAFVSVAMTKIPHDPIPSPEGIKIPDGFGEFAKGAVFSLWLSNPGPALNQRLKTMGIPLEVPAERLFVRLFPSDDNASSSKPAASAKPVYEAHVKITLPSATQARTIASFLDLARAFITPAQQPSPAEPFNDDKPTSQNAAARTASLMTSLLFANPVVQEEGSLLFKMPPLGVQEITLLFSVFSL